MYKYIIITFITLEILAKLIKNSKFLAFIKNQKLGFKLHPYLNTLMDYFIFESFMKLNFQLQDFEQLEQQLGKFYDIDFKFSANFQFQHSTNLKFSLLCLALFWLLQILLFVSSPGRYQPQTHCCQDGLKYECKTCQLENAKFCQHGVANDFCVDRFQQFQRDVGNDVGSQNYLLYLLSFLLQSVMLLLFQVKFFFLIRSLNTSLNQELGQWKTEDDFEVKQSLVSNLLALFTSKTLVQPAGFFVIALYRQYASIAVLMTDTMLIKQGMTASSFQQWHTNIKELARKKRAMLELQLKPEELSKELFGMRDQKSSNLLQTHVVITWTEQICEGMMVKFKNEKDELIDAKVLTFKEATKAISQMKYGEGFHKEFVKIVKNCKIQPRW